MNKSISENPKSGQSLFSLSDRDKGLWTNQWRSRCIAYFETLIPSYLSNEQAIILTTQEDVEIFVARLHSGDIDVSQLEYLCIVESISDFYEIFDFFELLFRRLPDSTKLLFTNFNWIWFPFFHLAGSISLTRRRSFSSFLYDKDIDSFLQMSGWEDVKKINRFLLPLRIPLLSLIFEDLLMRIPLIKCLSVNTFCFARKQSRTTDVDYTVSVIVPCKNEEKNVEAIVNRVPKIGSAVELLFVNDKSSDGTHKQLLLCQEKYPGKNIIIVEGPGRGKGAAIRSGMKHASGDICMILDADLAVAPEDLPQFYTGLKNRRADFLHGTRMVYPKSDFSMRKPNLIGNLFFAKIFSYIIDQRTTDTLCGTKVFWRKDWRLYEEAREALGDYDVWGDYNLIFGASRFGLKIAQLPVRYYERLEGQTKMTRRIREGIVMLKVSVLALWKVKFIR